MRADIATKGSYDKEVITPGDELSEVARLKAIEGNKTTVHTESGLVEDGKINTQKGVKSVITSIDGVGTKVQIYTNAFELYVKEFEKNGSKEEDKDELIEISTKIWKRMFHDLVAMNVDDLRGGEMGVVFTNILDINHVKGLRGDIFAKSFPEALKRSIEDIGLNAGNGEIAILGESQKFSEDLKDAIIWAKEELEQIKERRTEKNRTTDKGTKEFFTKDIKKSLHNIRKRRDILVERANKIEFNIGGTAEGVEGMNEKLVKMKAGHKIIIFSEDPTENGILSPRSNGITRIRDLIHGLAGKDWEILKFEEFLEIIGEEKSAQIPNELKKELKGLRMWDIVTGETTIYNQFVSQNILGGLDGDPIADVSGLAHITGNPLHKMASAVPDDRFMVQIDAFGLKTSQVIELLQHVGEEQDSDGNMIPISDESSKSSWNGNMAYAMIVPDESVDIILNKAKEKGKTAGVYGTVVEKDLENYNKKVVIKSAGINGNTVEKIEEIDRDMPELPKRYKHIHSGKVRETYEHPGNVDEMILVATDRISTNDIVHQSLIEGKGEALTKMSNFWFDILKNDPETEDMLTHMVDTPVWPDDFPEELKEKSVIVKKVTALPVEAIIRKVLMGSVAKEYSKETGKLGTGQFVGKGLEKFHYFEEAQFTPSTKGVTDTNIDYAVMYKELDEIVGLNPQWNKTAKGLAEEIKEQSLLIFKIAEKEALSRGYILGDTKLEFGMDKDGNLILIDEVLTQDSSRYIKVEDFTEGVEPNFHDKQVVRDVAKEQWEGKPRSDGEKYPLHFSDETIEKTQILYKEMNVAFS